MELKQGEFTDIMFMSRNSMAMPKSLGIVIELSIIGSLLSNSYCHRVHITQTEYNKLKLRQMFLLKERERC